MTGPGGQMADEEFEKHARRLLEESVTHVSGNVRSRLNQARQAAVAEMARGRRSFWNRLGLMPAAGAVAAAVLVAFVLWPHVHQGEGPLENGRASVEDLDLLADGDGLELVSDDSSDGSGNFYEWAVDQTQGDGPGETSS
jgi:hypothetical protein